MSQTSDPEEEQEAKPPFAIGELPPRKVAWLHPLQLFRTGYHALISKVATGFLDRREMLAAIETNAPPDDRPVGACTLVRDPGGRRVPASTLGASEELTRHDDVWIDYVADLGDSWDATFATALLIARRRLRVRGHAEHLPQANILLLGGDLVYPTPTRDAYRKRLRSAFRAAMWKSPRHSQPCVLAIPGNHDWYDGLTCFVREFCQGGWFGGWRLVQSRSYFAAKVAPGWWIWGIDIALDTRIDAPQQVYFRNVLKNAVRHDASAPVFARFEPGDRVILCTAKPVWLEDPRHSADAYQNLAYFVRDVMRPYKATAAVILAGDVHHYSRYECADPLQAAGRGVEQMIVSGGGGAYLSGTHHLPNTVAPLKGDAAPPATQTDSNESAPKRVDAEDDTDGFRAGLFPYPSHADSRRMALRALLLVCRPANWPFALAVGVIYCAIGWQHRASVAAVFEQWPDTFLQGVWDLLSGNAFWPYAVAIVAVAGCVAFAAAVNVGAMYLRIAWGFLHGASHVIVALAVAWLLADNGVIAAWVDRLVPAPPWLPVLPKLILGVVFILIGGVIGATLVGIYLVVSDRLFGWHRNDVFAVQSIVDYRNFLRMRIEKDGWLTIFPIGLARVPRQWRARVTMEPSEEDASAEQARPLYEPGDYELLPHLIEAPIRVPPDPNRRT